jgi:hypothetical protein
MFAKILAGVLGGPSGTKPGVSYLGVIDKITNTLSDIHVLCGKLDFMVSVSEPDIVESPNPNPDGSSNLFSKLIANRLSMKKKI